jgi:hypothetical protein
VAQQNLQTVRNAFNDRLLNVSDATSDQELQERITPRRLEVGKIRTDLGS